VKCRAARCSCRRRCHLPGQTARASTADARFPPHVCDRLLNHVTGAIQGVAAAYQRAESLAERKAV